MRTSESQSRLFLFAMIWRIVYGFFRIILGVSLLRVIGEPLAHFVRVIMEHELTGHTTDIVIHKLYTLLETHDLTITLFLAGYFIFWGVVEIVLSIFLLRRSLVAFPITMAAIMLFILYGIFRFTHTHSPILLLVLIIDLVILYLINREYRRLKSDLTVGAATLSDLPLRQS